jgi:EmrB/QacA subfamily drug resistance transporter
MSAAANVDTAPAHEALHLSSAPGRWVLLASVLGSGIAGIDATVVNIALPSIGRDLHVGFASLQWTVTAYTLTLASLILLGGSLGDRFGRRRIFVIGIAWFAIASMLCAVAPSIEMLVVARALQGVGGALLTPASLAIIQASYAREDRARAIGAWSALSGTSSAIAPFVGGWLIAAGSWRWVFVINAPLAALVIVLALRHMPETRDPVAGARVDVPGSLLGVIGLGGITAGVIEASHGWASPGVLVPLAVGIAALVAFTLVERRETHPMLPPKLFASRQFTASNVVTFLLYAAIGGTFLLLVVELQTVSGFSPLASGAALLPATAMMLLLASRFGQLAERIGPRIPMTVGPLICAGALMMLAELGPSSKYPTSVLPAVTILGFGLAVFVAPLTSTVLGSAPASQAGIASGVNNAVARAAGLLSVAALPVVVGLSGDVYDDARRFIGPFQHAMWICAGLQAAGGVLALLTIRRDRSADAPQPDEIVPTGSLTLSGYPAQCGHLCQAISAEPSPRAA